MVDTAAIKKETEKFRADFTKLKQEVGKMIVGMDEVVEYVLIGLFAGGHCLLEGVPGLGKTMLVRTMSEALDQLFPAEMESHT